MIGVSHTLLLGTDTDLTAADSGYDLRLFKNQKLETSVLFH